MIPQFLEIEAKKLLKIKLSKITSDITDKFVENLFVVNPDNKYQNIMLNLEEKVKESVLEFIKEKQTPEALSLEAFLLAIKALYIWLYFFQKPLYRSFN